MKARYGAIAESMSESRLVRLAGPHCSMFEQDGRAVWQMNKFLDELVVAAINLEMSQIADRQNTPTGIQCLLDPDSPVAAAAAAAAAAATAAAAEDRDQESGIQCMLPDDDQTGIQCL